MTVTKGVMGFAISVTVGVGGSGSGGGCADNEGSIVLSTAFGVFSENCSGDFSLTGESRPLFTIGGLQDLFRTDLSRFGLCLVLLDDLSGDAELLRDE